MGHNPLSHYWGRGVLLFAFATGGCVKNEPPSPPPPAFQSGAMRISLDITPLPVQELNPAMLTVQVKNAQGTPVSGASVTIDLLMPRMMDMGDTPVATKALRAGTYVGTGRFTMAGEWRADVTVKQDQMISTQSFPVMVK